MKALSRAASAGVGGEVHPINSNRDKKTKSRASFTARTVEKNAGKSNLESQNKDGAEAPSLLFRSRLAVG
jgi:hypothetical protein